MAAAIATVADQMPWTTPRTTEKSSEFAPTSYRPEPIRQAIQGLKYPQGIPSDPPPQARSSHPRSDANPSSPGNPTPLNWQSVPQAPLEFKIAPEIAPEITLDHPRYQLYEQLQTPHYRWLSQLILARPLLIWGDQCSGKTTFAAFVALLRLVLLGHSVSVSDPYAHQNTWPLIFAVSGAHYNYSEIDQSLAAYQQRVHFSTMAHTSIWDQVMQYPEFCNPRLVGQFFQGIEKDWRRSAEFPLLLTQAHRSEILGRDLSLRRHRFRQVIDIQLLSARDWLGNLRPSMSGIITGLQATALGEPIAQTIQLESWMQPEYLLTRFPELCQPQSPDLY
ncbi:MAG: hypothetical protein HC835_16280 [Oscillatoriales cyanobacterium RM2_1_1]|nr:hypothetical protein [Oscillatoriales cyanobacterium RM2_1_1]